MPPRKKKVVQPTISQQERISSEKRIDKLLELIDTVARVDTKMDVFCKDTTDELKDLKKELHAKEVDYSSINIRLVTLETEGTKAVRDILSKQGQKIETLEKDMIKSANERTEWKAEFDKWKWRLGVIAPVLTILITTAVIAVLQHFLGPFF